jgi:hypothetical protein
MTAREGSGARGWTPTSVQVREPRLLIRVVRDLFPERTTSPVATWGDVVVFRNHPDTTRPDLDAVCAEYERRLAIVTRALLDYAPRIRRAAA